MFTLQRIGGFPLMSGYLSCHGAQLSVMFANRSVSLAAANRRCVIVLQSQPWSKEQFRAQSSAAANVSASSRNTGSTFAPAFISRKNVVTTTKTQAEVTSSTTLGNAATPTKKLVRPSLPPNMVYRQSHQRQLTAGHSTLASFDMSMASAAAIQAESYTAPVADTTAARPLVLLFAWMLSKNAHIEKYREFWIARGYDILTLQTSPMDLLLPKIGGRRNAMNVFNFLSTIQPRYDQVLVHAFSVGGYQLCEFMDRMSEGCRKGEPEAIRLFKSMKGYIVDSCVFADDCAPGLSRAMTHNKVVQPLIESSIANFLNLTRSFTLEQYYKVQAHLFSNEMNVPGLLLFSRDDVVSNVQTNFQLGEVWMKKNIPTRIKCWDRSTHVLHYKENPQEYEYEVDKFVSELDTITKAPKRQPVPPEDTRNL